MTDEKSVRENYLPEGFDQMLLTFLHGTDQMVAAVLAVAAMREPEKYCGAVDQVQAGRLMPRILWEPGALAISLVDMQTGASIGDIFRYAAPALAARGDQH